MSADSRIDGLLSTTDAGAVSDFCRRVRAALGDRLVELRLFGSKARGDAGPDSDIDVLVVVDAPARRWSAAKTISHVAFDINLEHEVFISPIVVTSAVLLTRCGVVHRLSVLRAPKVCLCERGRRRSDPKAPGAFAESAARSRRFDRQGPVSSRTRVARLRSLRAATAGVVALSGEIRTATLG